MTDKPQPQKRQKGDIIFREGDSADCAYIIEAGRIEISIHREGGPFVLGELTAGEILGEMAMIDEFSRTATARVVEDCRLTVVTPQQIQQRIGASDPVVRSLLQILLTRYRSELKLRRGTPLPAEHSVLHHSGVQKIRFENELIKALETGDVTVVYQPIRRLDTMTIEGFEALVRWQHPRLGTIPPGELINLAEETELINTLENRVFTVAVEDLAAFQAAAPRKLFMSINISPRHTRDMDFLHRVRHLCAACGQETSDVILELTESVLVDVRELSAWARAAKDMGFGLTVDDFGTGFASLEYLTRLNPDIVKIDQSFVGSIVEDPRTVAVLRRILEMARDLDVRVIAEGAETADHLQALVALGFDMAQGFNIGRPLPRAATVELLAGTLPAADEG